MLLSSISNIILLSASILRRDFSILLSRISMSIILLVLIINYNSIYLLVLEKGISLYTGLYQCSANSHVFNLFILILSFFILGITSYYPRKVSSIYSNTNENTNKGQHSFESEKLSTILLNKTGEPFKIIEYSLIILFIVSGAIFLISTNDLISIFLSIELQSYGLYLLSSIYRNSELSTKAGLTYFLLGGLSSCIILLSQALLYINSGNTNLENIYILSSISSSIIDNLHSYDLSNFYSLYYINLSLIILSVGFLFKVSAAPFHFWSPDVYDSVPTTVTTFIAIIAKISIFVFLLELIHFTSNNYLNYDWSNNLLFSSLLSLIVGTVLGLTQSRIKRLFAYSTISHVGFILLSLSIFSIESVQAFMFYLIQYSISNLNAFIILISIGYFMINYYNNNKDYINLKEKNNSPIQLISQLKGFYKLNVMLALSLGITLFSFLGVPPLLGFFGKQMVLSAALDNGYVFMSLVAILTSVISAVYYLVIIKNIFFDENENISNSVITTSNENEDISNSDITTPNQDKSLNNESTEVALSGFLTSTISILTLIILVFMFIPNESLNLVRIISLFIFNV